MGRSRIALGLVVALLGAGCPPAAEPEVDAGPYIEPFDRVPLLFRANGSQFELATEAGWEPFFMNGVNFGLAQPGRNPGDIVTNREDIRRWLELAGELGTNNIRLYTLQSPEFYQEFLLYQRRHPDRPLWLVQGIWLDELEVETYVEQTDGFRDEIHTVIDAVHGNRQIDVRFGKAFGNYTADVSPFIIAWLIGREADPHVCEATDQAYPEMTSYTGEYLSVYGVHAMEVFVCWSMDEVMAYAHKEYDTQRPVGWSNWPTLDPLYHPTEPHDPEVSSEDFTEIDTAGFVVEPANLAGIYASYHAYPYFPEFIIYDPLYLMVDDAHGPNSYLGYLLDLKAHYHMMPLIIGEYGIPSSRGNGKFSPSGMHHGYHDEVGQGLGNVRQLQAIRDSGCAGGILFAWIDEWFKRSWVVERTELPKDRRQVWFNVMNPEQNFGLLAMDPAMPGTRQVDGMLDDWSGLPLVDKPVGHVRALWASADAEAVFLRLDVEPGAIDFDETVYYVGIDTIDSALGDTRFPDGLDATSPAGMEFVVRLDGYDTSEVLVQPSYDVYGFWHWILEEGEVNRPTPSDAGEFRSIWTIVNIEAFLDFEPFKPRLELHTGLLRHGTADPHHMEFDSLTDLHIDAKAGSIELRMPWTLLNFTDPSQRELLMDDLATKEIERAETPGLRFAVVAATPGGEGAPPRTTDRLPAVGVTPRFTWDTWEVPTFVERIKPAYYIFQAGIAELGLSTVTPGVLP
jgi:hypothetical protein